MVETLEGHVISEHSNHKRPVLVQHQIEYMLINAITQAGEGS